MHIQNQWRIISPVHSFGISVVTEIRDRKEEYSQSENPACNGDYFLWFLVLSRLDLNNIGLLHRVGNTSNLDWRRRYPWANIQQIGPFWKGHVTTRPDPQTFQTAIQIKSTGRTLWAELTMDCLDIPFSPFLSLTFVWTQLYFFILRTYHILLVLMALAFYQGQSASNILESNYFKTFRWCCRQWLTCHLCKSEGV